MVRSLFSHIARKGSFRTPRRASVTGFLFALLLIAGPRWGFAAAVSFHVDGPATIAITPDVTATPAASANASPTPAVRNAAVHMTVEAARQREQAVIAHLDKNRIAHCHKCSQRFGLRKIAGGERSCERHMPVRAAA